VGSRKTFLLGCFLQGIFVLACGLSETGIQLIMFRAMQGIAVSLCLPTAVSIITTSFPNGQRRNLGLAFMGAGQPTGFLIGLVLSGLFIDTIGWRAGYYMCAAVNALFFGASFFGIPKDPIGLPMSWSRLGKEIDWVGAGLACSCLALLSYVLA
jgi:MFS family permease